MCHCCLTEKANVAVQGCGKVRKSGGQLWILSSLGDPRFSRNRLDTILRFNGLEKFKSGYQNEIKATFTMCMVTS